MTAALDGKRPTVLTIAKRNGVQNVQGGRIGVRHRDLDGRLDVARGNVILQAGRPPFERQPMQTWLETNREF